MHIHLQDICGCFPTILAELNSYDTHCMTYKAWSSSYKALYSTSLQNSED